MGAGDLVNNYNQSSAAAAGALQGIKGAQETNQTKLQAYLQGLQKQADVGNALDLKKGEAGIESGITDTNIGKVKNLISSGALPEGSGVNLGAGGNVGVTRGINTANVAPKEALAFNKIASASYKPIQDQLEATQMTLDYLDQKNANSDKLAIMNEVKANGAGSRAMATMYDKLSGGRTIGMDVQDKYNYLMNLPNFPTMQDAQRDAIRESAYGRIPQLTQMHQQRQTQLMQQGAQLAPHADYGALVKAISDPVSTNLSSLAQRQEAYKLARSKQQGAPISSPSIADPNPTTMDKLRGFFKKDTAKSQPAPQAIPNPGIKQVAGKTWVKDVNTGIWNVQEGQK